MFYFLKKRTWIIGLFFICISKNFNSKINEICTNKKSSCFKMITIDSLLKNSSLVHIDRYLKKTFYSYKSFPLSSRCQSEGFCTDSFILHIPNGRAQGIRGDIFLGNNYIKDMAYMGLWKLVCRLPKVLKEKIQKISGSVAVISQDLTKYYFHWIQDILGRLALLEMHGVEYDYLYVPCDKKYMKETLELWGINPDKIIAPDNSKFCIQGDELIVPSLVTNKNQNSLHHIGFHTNPITMNYVAQKLLKAAKLKNIDTKKFSKKIFISRNDHGNKRKILNEDKVFALLKKKGFVCYELSKMSVAEQIMLFANADIVVGEHGAGLTNCLFCKPKTKIIEIFQALVDSSFWWIAQTMNLDYSCIKTVDIDVDYFFSQGIHSAEYKKAWKSQINVSLKKIKKEFRKI